MSSDAFVSFLACQAVVCLACAGAAPTADFSCSDPFVVRDDAAGLYRLYHNMPRRAAGPRDDYVVMRTSKDLVTWSDPVGVLPLPESLNCDSLWAPEVHARAGKWYLFGTVHKPVDPKSLLPVLAPDFHPERRKTYLGTWVFAADRPEGPFRPTSDAAITPADWSALDGTLFVEDGKPHMVFCHEWTQLRDGTIDAVELSGDLARPVGKPFTLLRASAFLSAVDGQPQKVPHGVTDGPFLYRSKNGSLLMLWSTGHRSGYVQGVSRSESGRLAGPWSRHAILRKGDSGHGMLFTTFDGTLAIALHSPNTPHAAKRLRIFAVEDLGDTLRIGRQIGGLFDGAASFRTESAPTLRRLSLDGLWDFRLEEGKPLEAVSAVDFVADDKMTVPGCWDTVSKYYNRRGTGLYRRTFELEKASVNATLEIDGCALRSKYWIDGRPVGFSALPWIRFELPVGDLAPGRHEIVAAVDSLVDNAKVKLFWNFYDFYPFGGFYHGVNLILPERPVQLKRVVVRTRDYTTGRIELETQFAAAKGKGPDDFEADVAFNGGDAVRTRFRNRRAELTVPGFRTWSPESPALMTVRVTCDGRAAETRFGIRQVGTAKGRVTLNGKPVYLKGVNRHEAHFEFGPTTPVQLLYEDLQNARALGCNFIRGSHYPQSDAFLTLCDELGFLVWEESLGWGNGKKQLEDPEFRRLQEEETRLTVRNSINHPSVIISAFLNEPDSTLPVCKSLVDRLVDVIRAEDTGHLVTFACHRALRDISHAKTDIIAYNAYPCWYSHELETGSSEEMRRNIRACHEEIVRHFRDFYGDGRPILVSETGVKADYGVRDPRGRAQYTEDFQAEYTRTMLEELLAMKDIAGIAIWQFTDAKTYTRTKGLRNRSYGVNTGGLYDLYRRPKLAAEEVRKAFGKGTANDR